jgi:hypothetical protein
MRMGIQCQQGRRRHMGAGRPAARAGAVKCHALDAMHGGNGHLMVPAKIGNRGSDAIFSRTQPHAAQQDQTSAALDGFLIEDPGKVFFGKGNRGAGGG